MCTLAVVTDCHPAPLALGSDEVLVCSCQTAFTWTGLVKIIWSNDEWKYVYWEVRKVNLLLFIKTEKRVLWKGFAKASSDISRPEETQVGWSQSIGASWCFPYWQPYCHLPSHADSHIPSGPHALDNFLFSLWSAYYQMA